MGVGKGSGRRAKRARIGATAMGEYVGRLSKGANHGEAAEGAGFSRSAFARLRRRDAEFAAACEAAIGRSSGKRFIHGAHGRRLQLRRGRRTLFTAERQEVFLAHFAGTANTAEAADLAGVCEGTVNRHRREDADFNRRFLEALDQSLVTLHADLVARRIAEQKRLRDIEPTGEPEPEFERAMKLLERWDRRRGPPDSRAVAPGGQKRWNFDEALALLERMLRNRGIPIEPLPPGYERPDGDRRLPPPGPDREGDDGSGDGGGEDGQ